MISRLIPTIDTAHSRTVLNLNHFEVTSYEDLPYTHVEHLGYGAYAMVDKVKDETGRMFARKVFRRRFDRCRESVRSQFFNEIQIARALQQSPHMIQILESYSYEKGFALIIEPVADSGTLEEFLANQKGPGGLAVLQKAFGCLTNGLAFIHKKSIRHKDVSPANILVHQGKLLFSDFGISIDCSFTQTTTDSQLGVGHRRYSAPEVVAEEESRNRKSDVFSLAAVFCEIISKLKGWQYEKSSYADRIEQLILTLMFHDQRTDDLPEIVYQVTAMMLSRNKDHRLRAERACAILAREALLFCHDCRLENGIPLTTNPCHLSSLQADDSMHGFKCAFDNDQRHREFSSLIVEAPSQSHPVSSRATLQQLETPSTAFALAGADIESGLPLSNTRYGKHWLL